MGRAKEIVMRVIPSTVANPFIRAHHYSGKVVNNSKLHFGVFLDGQLHGVMSYGPSLDKSKIIGLVADTGWNEFLELNRMAFDSVLPRNSESRAISMSIKLIRKYAPQVKWIISFADACSCGDGAIYRASNFVLTGIKENMNLAELPDGTRIHKMTLASNPTTPRKELHGLTFFDVTGGTYDFKKYLAYVGATPIPGYQLRYLYFIDQACRAKLTVPEIPFSRIDELGAGMYKGEKISQAERHKYQSSYAINSGRVIPKYSHAFLAWSLRLSNGYSVSVDVSFSQVKYSRNLLVKSCKRSGSVFVLELLYHFH